MAKGGFRGGMGGGFNMNMIKQAQKMQNDMLKAQAELEAQEYTASSGGGMVTATVTGKKQLIRLDIKPEAVDPDDVEMLEDLIMAAINDGYSKADKVYEEKMGKYGNMGSLGGMI